MSHKLRKSICRCQAKFCLIQTDCPLWLYPYFLPSSIRISENKNGNKIRLGKNTNRNKEDRGKVYWTNFIRTFSIIKTLFISRSYLGIVTASKAVATPEQYMFFNFFHINFVFNFSLTLILLFFHWVMYSPKMKILPKTTFIHHDGETTTQIYLCKLFSINYRSYSNSIYHQSKDLTIILHGFSLPPGLYW